jgi:hypothetical protein
MSCIACRSIFISSVKIAPRDTDSTRDSGYSNPHHDNIAELCQSARDGYRICNDIWRYFFEQKPPEQYTAQPFFHNGDTFDQSIAMHSYVHAGTTYRFQEVPNHLVNSGSETDAMLLEFTLSSHMNYDLGEFSYLISHYKIGMPVGDSKAVKQVQTSSGYVNMISYDKNAHEK